ncbi:uncharacterized protein OCT59_014534 [Rhizophagus irregularis]|uniref:uncharacterized protein n=1 Tax=Rhizophagus irregularis TaxID=588596 RepID=UPI0033258E34|nr:hypothetical protein OCT59_014534 [Rhizophagus irregularis]
MGFQILWYFFGNWEMQRVFRKSAKVQRIFLWETGNANGFSGNANGSEVEFESLNCLGISSIRYVVSEYLDKGNVQEYGIGYGL